MPTLMKSGATVQPTAFPSFLSYGSDIKPTIQFSDPSSPCHSFPSTIFDLTTISILALLTTLLLLLWIYIKQAYTGNNKLFVAWKSATKIRLCVYGLFTAARYHIHIQTSRRRVHWYTFHYTILAYSICGLVFLWNISCFGRGNSQIPRQNHDEPDRCLQSQAHFARQHVLLLMSPRI